MKRNPMKRRKQKIAWSLIAIMMVQALALPTSAYALTGGPKQPEFTSFTPIATSDMVNTFTGDFMYNLPVLNIPGADGGGYALSLSYNANPSVEGMASWVGNNWSLNPGVLNRTKRGLPDDWKNKNITQYNKTRLNWTVGYTKSFNPEVEFCSQDPIPLSDIGGNVSYTKRYNSYTGFSRAFGAGISLFNTLNLNMNLRPREVTFSASFSLIGLLSQLKKKKAETDNGRDTQKPNPIETKKTKARAQLTSNPRSSFNSLLTAYAGTGLVAMMENNFVNTHTASQGFSASFEFNITTGIPIGPQFGDRGFFSLQRTQAKTDMNAYGYMYNPSNVVHKAHFENQEQVMSDYYIEKAAPYSRRDNIVGIAFNNADYFNATGEGITGSFRLWHDKIGHFYPNHTTTSDFNFDLGINLNVGPPPGAGIGIDIGGGYHKGYTQKWMGKNVGSSFPGAINNFEFDSNIRPHFRMNGDMGGEIDYSTSSDLESATLNGLEFEFNPTIPSTGLSTNRTTAKGHSTHMEYLTVREIIDNYLGDPKANFERNARILDYIVANTGGGLVSTPSPIDETVAQIKIWNPDGMQYVYGLPSMTQNESNLTYGIANGANIENNYLAYYPEINTVPEKNKTVIGEEMTDMYASMYLLTQIATYDYVDVTNNGPTDDDFGGYTRFDYRKWRDDNGNSWYNYREPYTGLFYSPGRLADTRDDIGSANTGERQNYYLNAIETKTHIALFITNRTDASQDFAHLCPQTANCDCLLTSDDFDGSSQDRKDGLGADFTTNNIGQNSYWNAASDPTAKNNDQKVEKLERIVLFSKNDLCNGNSVPLVVTYFDYDYSIWPNIPNNEDGNYPNNSTLQNNGKLTLKKVWFEYQGVRNHKISPYEFSYTYKPKSTLPSYLLNRYPAIINDWPNYSVGAECPKYSPHSNDMWGYHQYKGEERKAQMKPWVFQGNYDNNLYDPAAWQLKGIKLPSGGEILIHYEQNSYQYVQDRQAMAMVSLTNDSQDDGIGQQNRFYLNTEADLGIAQNNAVDLQTIADYIRKEYVEKEDKRLYFKFLYALEGFSAQLNNRLSEYIDGYAALKDVGVDPTKGLWIEFGKSSANSSFKDRTDIPRRLCYDYIQNEFNMGSAAAAFQSFENGNVNDNADYTNNSTARALAFQVVEEILGSLIPGAEVLAFIDESLGLTQCLDINESLSYIRIPIVKQSKKGGGVRVKRLLMYDNGLETGDAQLYGTTYKYETMDGKSSGVATNEPGIGREENALVNYEPRLNQSFFNRIIAGEDQKELEAPFGENLLPAPIIGYSRVIVENIYTGKASNGYREFEYFTCKDYPYDREYKDVDDVSGPGVSYTKINKDADLQHRRKSFVLLPLGIVNYTRNVIWTAQGFRFIQNQMHGKIRREATYPGTFISNKASKIGSPTLETTYEYYEPGERVNVMHYNSTDRKYVVAKKAMGKEVDITLAMQATRDETFNLNVEFDISFIGPPSVLVCVSPSFSYTQQGLSSHMTTKVISYPVILKAVETRQNMAVSRTEHLAFNAHTGAPILTRITDGFHNLYLDKNPNIRNEGYVYSWTLPAAWYYADMGQRANNPNASNQLTANAGSISTYGKDGNILADLNSLNQVTWTDSPKGVMSASASTFKKDWLTNEAVVQNDYNIQSNNTALLTQLDAFYRPVNSFVYEAKKEGQISQAKPDGDNPVYKAGILDDFTMFDWSSPPIASNQSFTGDEGWRWTGTITKYSPNGYPLEEINPLGIPSASRYGYENFLPVLVAQNAEYSTVHFKAYEDENIGSNGITNAFAHSGKLSKELSSSTLQTILNNIQITQKIQDINRGGLQLKFWAYSNPNAPLNPTEFNIGLANNNATITTTPVSPTFVAQVGNWKLLELVFTPSQLQAFHLTDVLELQFSYSGGITYIDDIRLQPRFGEMMAYVYDNLNFRLLTTFDDQHFGVFYQYDEEGMLIRKFIETERGMKLLQENQNNSQTQTR